MQTITLNKISDQASAIRDWCRQYAAGLGGTASVVSNLQDLWKQAYQNSQRPLILICYNGENARGSFEFSNAFSRVDRNWLVLIKEGRGYLAERGDKLTETTSVSPFYDQVEGLRDWLRRLLNVSAELPTIDYKGISPVSQGDQVIDAYVISFSTANDIPQILTSPDNSPT